jgi:hypothetical protein
MKRLTRLLVAVTLSTLVITSLGCITNADSKKDATDSPDTKTVTVGGYLSQQNEYRHGVWFVEVVQGGVVTVKVLHTNATVWTSTDYTATEGGILIQSRPEPLSIGDQYRITLAP